MATGFQYLIEVDVDHELLTTTTTTTVLPSSVKFINNHNHESDHRHGLGVIYAINRQSFSCYLFFFGTKMKKQITPSSRQSLKISHHEKINTNVKGTYCFEWFH
ncbi:unnamed protein product [Schistosoma curassoni]|uniref:Uncharacterized protein n=1 Tax=Schistosoma curassoni TaxID=6186 RepID=A0A183KVB4_9TREM|nr:unnamed protein product [Schistosoma curassoni]